MLMQSEPRTLQEAADLARLAGERETREQMRGAGRKVPNIDDEAAGVEESLRLRREFGFADQFGRPTHRHRWWMANRRAPFTRDEAELRVVAAAMEDARALAAITLMLEIEDLTKQQRAEQEAKGRSVSENILTLAQVNGMDAERLLGLCEERIDAEEQARRALFRRRAA